MIAIQHLPDLLHRLAALERNSAPEPERPVMSRAELGGGEAGVRGSFLLPAKSGVQRAALKSFWVAQSNRLCLALLLTQDSMNAMAITYTLSRICCRRWSISRLPSTGARRLQSNDAGVCLPDDRSNVGSAMRSAGRSLDRLLPLSGPAPINTVGLVRQANGNALWFFLTPTERPFVPTIMIPRLFLLPIQICDARTSAFRRRSICSRS